MTEDPEFPERQPDDARTRAIVEFALKVTRDAHTCTPDDLERLRQVGLSDEEIFDVAETAAMFNFTNRLTSALGMEPNAEFDRMGRPG